MTELTQQRRLVLRAQSGDRDAFDALLREIAPPLLRYVARVTGDAALAEDVVQETLVLIVRKISWLSDPSLFKPWAYRIASREAFRALKKRGRQEIVPVGETDRVVCPPPEDPWQRERLLASLERLSPASRAVITLHYLEEMPLSEVAAVLDLAPGTRQVATRVRTRAAPEGDPRMKKRIEPHLVAFLVIDFLISLSIVVLVILKKG